ncbi:MAG: hypothetical protein IJV17_05495 [Prevotella sp.]|nr:hypothetical protein [Prevotella sp.]
MYKYFERKDLRIILDLTAEQVESLSGKPDKTIDSFYDPNDNGNCRLINQFRIYQKAKRFVVITENEIIIIPFSIIIGYSVVNLNEKRKPLYSATITTTKTDNGDMIKRAVIGGAVAGGVGAVIGGLTAKRNTRSSFSSAEEYANMMNRYMDSLPDLELTINIDDILSPSIKIPFDQCKRSIETMAETLNVIIRRNAELDIVDNSMIEIVKSSIFSICRKIELMPANEFGMTARMVKELEQKQQEQEIRQKKLSHIAITIIVIIVLLVLITICS